MGRLIPGYEPTKGQKQKAVKFMREKRVRDLQATVFYVEGDTDNYVVILFPEESGIPHVCNCKREDTCSHILAALTVNSFGEELIEEAAHIGT